MNRLKIAQKIAAILASAALLAGSAYADKPTSEATVGEKIDNSMQKMGHFFDDSATTAKVKATLMESDVLKGSDISVTTHQGVVKLNGFVTSQDQAASAVTLVKRVEGVKSVSDQLHVKASQPEQHQSMRSYAADAAVTSKIKAKYLTSDGIPARNIKVETYNGIVQLSGEVDTQAQSNLAESMAKEVKDVISVKNDLKVRQ